MLESFSGTYVTYSSAGITSVEDIDKRINQIKEWFITISTTEATISSNEGNAINFTNTLASAGDYVVDFITRAFLATIEDELADEDKFSDALITNKINVTRMHLEKKIKAHFRNLYTLYPNDEDPMDRIINLDEMQVAFAYYCIAECYSDTTLISDDMNVWNEEKFRNRYKEIIKDCLNLLAVDSDNNGEIDNADKAENIGRGVILAR